jgi:hypothetical protein
VTTAVLAPAPEQQLVDAVDALLSSPAVGLAPAHALDRLGTVLTESERLAVVALDAVHDMDERELFALDGAGSTTGWLRARRTGGDPRLRAFARRLQEHPGVRDAVLSRRLGTDAAQVVCSALSAVPAEVDEATLRGVVVDGAQQVLTEMFGASAAPADVAELAALCRVALEQASAEPWDRLEPVFVFLAQQVPPAVLRRTLRDLVEALVPALLDEECTDRYDGEHFDLQQVLDGRWHADGYLDPETGAALNAELDRRMATEPHDPLAVQSTGKRRAQALGSLARDGRGCDGAGNTRPAADICIVVRDQTLTDRPGALPARMSDGTRLRLDTVRRLGCDGRLSAVVLDAYGQPVGASGTHRHATRRERRALHAQWGGCAVDGCNQPFARTRPHHVIPWWLSKITRLKDLAPVCEHHHHDIHEGNRTLRLRDGRHISPLGWTDRPAG